MHPPKEGYLYQVLDNTPLSEHMKDDAQLCNDPTTQQLIYDRSLELND